MKPKLKNKSKFTTTTKFIAMALFTAWLSACSALAQFQNRDSDGDGIPDWMDNCVSVPNSDQLDSDGDGIGDACDNCSSMFNPNQEDSEITIDLATGIIRIGDGVGDFCDNCKLQWNPSQRDRDHDGKGDACDPCPDDPFDTCMNQEFVGSRTDWIKECKDLQRAQLQYRGDSVTVLVGNPCTRRALRAVLNTTSWLRPSPCGPQYPKPCPLAEFTMNSGDGRLLLRRTATDLGFGDADQFGFNAA